MKILFAGTPAFAVQPLEMLIKTCEVVAVITQEDKIQGRKKLLTPSPVKTCALSHNLPVFQPQKIREHIDRLKSFKADAMITCAYGQILTQEVLDCFPKGVWNIHAGLLPAYRGASPVQSCILNGETETGVCVMQTVLALDAGDILLCEKLKIGEKETAGELSNRLSALSAALIQKAAPLIESGAYTLQKQGETGAHIYRKITREQAKIDFTAPAPEIVNQIRAMNPEPVAFSYLRGAIVNFYAAEVVPEAALSEEQKKAKCGEVLTDKPKSGLLVRCGACETNGSCETNGASENNAGAIKINFIQPAGGKIMTGADFLNGKKAVKGEIFE